MRRDHLRKSVFAVALAVVAVAGCGVAPATPWLAELQPPYIWRQAIGGPGNDVGNAVVETADGGFLVTGYTDSYGAGGIDAWVIRTDGRGDTLWTRTYGGEANDHAWDAVAAPDGGFVIVGFTASYGAGGEDIWLLRLDEDGDTLWTRTYGGGGDERAWALTAAGDGGWVIAAQTRPANDARRIDLYLVRVTRTGEVVWTRRHGGPGVDRVLDVERTPDGGFVFAGLTSESVGADQNGYLVRVDADGRVLWDRRFGAEANETGNGIQLAPDGGLLMIGYSEIAGAGRNDIWLVRTDANGRELWSQRIGEARDQRAMMGARLSGGGYLIVGYSGGGSGNWDANVLKVDDDGQRLWSKQFGESGPDRGVMVRELNGGEFILTGAYGNTADGSFDVMLVRFRGED